MIKNLTDCPICIEEMYPEYAKMVVCSKCDFENYKISHMSYVLFAQDEDVSKFLRMTDEEADSFIDLINIGRPENPYISHED